MKKAILFLLCISLLWNITWAQERSIIRRGEDGLRFALVIGNADYQQTAKLRNPVNDVRAINSTLSELGFTVTALENADQRQMENAIRKFGKTLRTDRAIGLFYYAGHGMQIDGENCLVPVEANPSNEDDVRYDGVPVGKLLGQMKNAGNSMNVVILDACRNKPFTRNFRSNRRGLAQVTAPTGTFISCERKYLNLAESKTPAIPTTLLVGKPEYFCNAITITSSGLVMHMTKALGDEFFIPSATCLIIFKLVPNRSSLVIPGFLGIPAVIIMTSEFFMSS